MFTHLFLGFFLLCHFFFTSCYLLPFFFDFFGAGSGFAAFIAAFLFLVAIFWFPPVCFINCFWPSGHQVLNVML